MAHARSVEANKHIYSDIDALIDSLDQALAVKKKSEYDEKLNASSGGNFFNSGRNGFRMQDSSFDFDAESFSYPIN